MTEILKGYLKEVHPNPFKPVVASHICKCKRRNWIAVDRPADLIGGVNVKCDGCHETIFVKVRP